MKIIASLSLAIGIVWAAPGLAADQPAISAENLLSAPLRLAEAETLKHHSDVARREGSTLIITRFAGTSSAREAGRFTDDDGACERYQFVGVKALFSPYLHAITQVPELNCDNGDIAARFLLRDSGKPFYTFGRSIASSDGQFLVLEGNPVYAARPSTEVINWQYAFAEARFDIACREVTAQPQNQFMATCLDFYGIISEDKSWNVRLTRYLNGDEPYQSTRFDSRTISISNGGNVFEDTQREATRIALKPGMARRDGPDLIILDKGKEMRRLTDAQGCERYWFDTTMELYDADLSKRVPVAVVTCQQGEFEMSQLVPAKGDILQIPQGAVASDDGKTVLLMYGSTEIVDWPTRKVLLRLPERCVDAQFVRPGLFTAKCENYETHISRRVRFERDASGTWTAS
ncbi:hypothetical protein PQU92_11800 [Asticcacaulis sp. BYS171W]|uniref:Uncharacterized protein n=1 Tax=Asticcacaulis aquaticus TaxID=2984212 RepID=A0ABT5HVJ3_9CAUL|nr:hypothetical protein [Asticcacaulis aquaticus]MDC7683963.1 hypothetical protein [Asticcacaulis aquaticus]